MKRLIFLLAIVVIHGSCSHKNYSTQVPETNENFIIVTQEQFDTGGMAIGEPVRMVFEGTIKCNGYIITKPSGSAWISSPVPGLVKKIYCSGGQKVKSGQVLFELGGNEFIELQTNMAETASQLKKLKSEYERIQSLFSDKISTEKELIQAESEFNASKAKYSALKMKIRILGLDVSEIEKGNLYETFCLESPLNGYISGVDVSVGQFVEQQMTLAEVIDPSLFQLKLAIFEKDMAYLKEQQKVRFSLIGSPDKTFNATLKSIGKDVEEESKAIICYAGIDDPNRSAFIKNAYVEADIITTIDTVYAVPEESVLRSEGSSYILELIKRENELYYLRRTRTEAGRRDKGFAEIIRAPDNMKLVTKGAYNLPIE